jgi:hypothetical protein
MIIFHFIFKRVDDEDEVEPISSNRNSKIYEPETGDRLLNQDSKRGGATQV